MITNTLRSQGLTEFASKNKKVLEENRLNVDDVTVKTRIMALLALASKSSDVTFSAVQVRGYCLPRDRASIPHMRHLPLGRWVPADSEDAPQGWKLNWCLRSAASVWSWVHAANCCGFKRKLKRISTCGNPHVLGTCCSWQMLQPLPDMALQSDSVHCAVSASNLQCLTLQPIRSAMQRVGTFTVN